MGSEDLWKKIRAIVEQIQNPPFTEKGRQISNQIQKRLSVFFEVYPNIFPLIKALICYIELQVGAEFSENNFFQEGDNQIVLLKALGYYAESQLKKNNYSRYQTFFDELEKGIKTLENQIKASGGLKNFTSSLAVSFNNAIHKIPGADQVNISLSKIKEKFIEFPEKDSFVSSFDRFIKSVNLSPAASS